MRTQQIHEFKKKEKEYIKLQVGPSCVMVSLHMKIIYLRSNWKGNYIVIALFLQERLNQVLMEKKKESRSGMEIMNLLQVINELLIL